MKSFRTILRNKTAVGAAQQQQYNLHLKAHAEEVLLNSSNKSEEVAWFLGLAAASAAESRPQAINPLTHTTKHTQPQPHTTRHHKPYKGNNECCVRTTTTTHWTKWKSDMAPAHRCNSGIFIFSWHAWYISPVNDLVAHTALEARRFSYKIR